MMFLALALTFAVAVQGPTENETDIRCAIAASALRRDTPKTAEQQNQLMSLMLFYVGRLSARLSPSQIQDLFNQRFASVKPEQYEAIAKDCTRDLLRFSGAR